MKKLRRELKRCDKKSRSDDTLQSMFELIDTRLKVREAPQRESAREFESNMKAKKIG